MLRSGEEWEVGKITYSQFLKARLGRTGGQRFKCKKPGAFRLEANRWAMGM